MNKKHLLPLLMLVISAGCMPETPGSPMRKKLPPDETKIPFVLSDPANDSAVVALLNTYRPLAIPMLTRWAKEQRGGIVVDFRSGKSEVPQSAAYVIEREDAFTIPVELIWDSRSAARAAHFLRLASDYKEVNITRTNGAASDCFSTGLNF